MNLPKSNREFEALLYYLKHERGCDLTGYKRSTLMRRFEHRMRSINIDSYDSYLHYLQSHSEEYQTLLEDVRINVTCFFRDSDAWSYLASDIIPRIIGNKQSDEPIRVWSAGCASGEEIYSLLTDGVTRQLKGRLNQHHSFLAPLKKREFIRFSFH